MVTFMLPAAFSPSPHRQDVYGRLVRCVPDVMSYACTVNGGICSNGIVTSMMV